MAALVARTLVVINGASVRQSTSTDQFLKHKTDRSLIGSLCDEDCTYPPLIRPRDSNEWSIISNEWHSRRAELPARSAKSSVGQGKLIASVKDADGNMIGLIQSPN
jgi:hypothetical protein